MLERDDRIRFGLWCKGQAKTCSQMAEQIEKLGAIPALANRERQKAIAFEIVAAELLADREEVTISKRRIGGAE